jgi:hypothetical protein
VKARICWLTLTVALAAALSCSRKLPPAEQTYTVRGFITSLPSARRPASELMIRHEAIPTFVDREGKVVGMAPMEMPFTPAPGVSLEGLSVGQPVQFTLEVRWKPPARINLTRITPLPAETTLNVSPPGH